MATQVNGRKHHWIDTLGRVGAVRIIFSRGSSSGGGGSSDSWTAWLLGIPAGQILFGAVAIGILLGGLNQLKEAVKADFVARAAWLSNASEVKGFRTLWKPSATSPTGPGCC